MAAASAIWYQNNFDDLLAIASTLVEKRSMTRNLYLLELGLTICRIHARLDQ